MKKLLSYKITGQTYIENDELISWTYIVGIDVESWESKDLYGHEPFIIINSVETIPDEYSDISSIEYWDKFGYNITNDYSVVKFAIKDIVTNTGWSNLTSDEKYLAIQYFSYPDTTSAVIYLITEKGMSQTEAISFLTLEWHKHHLKTIESFKMRWNYAKLTVLSYIDRLDGEDLFNTVKPLIDLYTDVGVLGIDFNDNQDGIYDYIYSINGFEDNGLEENNYTLLQGTWTSFKTTLKNVLVYGDYEKYI